MPAHKYKFPKDFMWGASTSSYQIEGGSHTQWTAWELAHATELTQLAKRRRGWVPTWDEIKDQAQDPENYVNGRAVDHFRRYKEDFAIAKKLNLTAFRFGVEWARIEPVEGHWDEEAIAHYKRYIAELQKMGIQPVINLWHWTVPVWFEERGGFAKKKNIDYFVRFVDRIAFDLIMPCKWVMTVNEPNTFAAMGYLEGHWPPQRHNPFEAIKVMMNLATAHKRVYKELKRLDPHLQVGAATQCGNNQPKRPNSRIDRLVARSVNYFWNWWFLNRIRRNQDFVGFTHYFTDYYRGFIRKNPEPKHIAQYRKHTWVHKRRLNPESPTNDMGWYMEPYGIYKVIMQVAKRYKKPIIIAENGVADHKDQYRKWWIDETIRAVERANREGADVIGYFHWSLLDNFEWADGWWPKFGLVGVDREHGMERKVRPSAKWFAGLIKRVTETT